MFNNLDYYKYINIQVSNEENLYIQENKKLRNILYCIVLYCTVVYASVYLYLAYGKQKW